MSNTEKIITKDQVFSRMARICSQKECCVFDIRQKLVRLKFPDEAIDEIINKLKKEKYIDENRFAKSFINDKLRFNKWGKAKIETALWQKRISGEIIENAFSEFPDSSMTDSLRPLLEKKWKTIKGKTDYEKSTKLIRFALGRGFAMKDILKCIKSMNLVEPEDEF